MAGETTGNINHPGNLKLFGPGGGGGLELGWSWPGAVTLLGQIEFTGVGTIQWENYANDHGSDIDAYAAQFNLHLLILVGAVNYKAYHLALRFGLGLTRIWGEEENHDYDLTYDYADFKTAFSIRLGLDNSFMLRDDWAITAIIDFDGGSEAVSRADTGDFELYLGFTAMLGTRYWFN